MALEGMLIARREKDLLLLPRMANRHGLVAGATGTGETGSLQVMAEHIIPMGPPLFSGLLNLNDVQSGVLSIAFRIADDNALHLLDFKCLRAMAQYAGDHADEFETDS